MIEGQPEEQQDQEALFNNDQELDKIELEVAQFE
jgi:hypothetical protein